MNREILKAYQTKAEFFKALSHPTRLYILNTIKDKRMSVKELSNEVDIDISTMSKHLDILKRLNIIKGEKDKNFIYYHLEMPCILEFMSCANNQLFK